MPPEPRADAPSVVSPRPDRVLVVDDEASVRDVIAATLLRNGYDEAPAGPVVG